MKGVVFAVLSVSFAVACGSEDDSLFPQDKPAEGTFSPPVAAPGPTGATPASSGTADCSEAAKLVYVVSAAKDLYSFAPDKLVFTKIGHMDCPSAGVAASMAVDRSGTAWVNYADGALYKVSTTDAKCTPTGFVPEQQGFKKFGMAFATNAAGSTQETLFISGLLGAEGKGFGKIDVGTLKLTMLGDYSNTLATKAAELTGSGNGKLYGFFSTSPAATLAEIDQGAGATASDKSLDGVSTGNAFAFSFWGGDFWFYTSEALNPSRVTQMKAASGSGETVVAKADVGFRIVGAGVSTCAPTSPLVK